jgi:hypothetical protein
MVASVIYQEDADLQPALDRKRNFVARHQGIRLFNDANDLAPGVAEHNCHPTNDAEPRTRAMVARRRAAINRFVVNVSHRLSLS